MFLETLTERFTSIAASAGVLPYGIIFAVIFIESIILIGFFMPAETLLVLIGFLISEGVIRFPFLDMVLSRELPRGVVRQYRVSGTPMFDVSCTLIGYRGFGVEILSSNK